MKKSRFTDSQIMSILKQAEAGTPVDELCREHGMSNASFYKWRSRFGGMDASMIARLKELEDENRRLKKMYAEERLKVNGSFYRDTYTEPVVKYEFPRDLVVLVSLVRSFRLYMKVSLVPMFMPCIWIGTLLLPEDAKSGAFPKH
jgi:putative transposase